MSEEQDRHSGALDAELIADPEERAKREARNGLKQFDAVIELIEYFSEPQRKFKLRPSHLLHLHRTALDGISSYAGNFRPAGTSIGGSKHEPMGAHLVPGAIEEMCDYVNEEWERNTPIHLAAYALWKLNWIHPFTDGNGRTARALSYLLLCLRLGYRIPGTDTIPDQISKDKSPYYKALEAADQAWAAEKIDLSVLEEYVGDLLAIQLLSVHQAATGGREKKTVNGPVGSPLLANVREELSHVYAWQLPS
ncbi:MAG TPA: Fic family protein [Terriglobales bacterium]|nr:Fic family protein [Terriglobales bacterium]